MSFSSVKNTYIQEYFKKYSFAPTHFYFVFFYQPFPSWFPPPGWVAEGWQSRRKAHHLTTLILPCCCLASTRTVYCKRKTRPGSNLLRVSDSLFLSSSPLGQKENAYQQVFHVEVEPWDFPGFFTPAWAQDQFPAISPSWLNFYSDFSRADFHCLLPLWWLLCIWGVFVSVPAQEMFPPVLATRVVPGHNTALNYDTVIAWKGRSFCGELVWNYFWSIF